MGVTRERSIGVDVENTRAREVDIELADRFFAPEEVAALRTLPDEKQQQRFFEYWTMKESYIKARRRGLSIPLKRFAFYLEDPEQIRLTIDLDLQDYVGRWWFWQLRVDHDHLTALCAERGGAERPHLASVRRWPSKGS
jgi:4'-phosphopantetheinyl transferase